MLASSPPVPQQADFDVVLRLIEASRGRAVAAVNAELVELYWRIGEHISQRIESAKEPSRCWPSTFRPGIQA